MEEELHRIGIDLPGEYTKNGSYVIDIPNSNEYGRIYSKLENWPSIKEDEDASQSSSSMSSIQYDGQRNVKLESLYSLNEDDEENTESKDFTITLIADLDNDEYKLVMKER